MNRINIIVSGRVQGVGFRAFVQQKANESGLSGWTRNLPDGNVEIEVEGTKDQIDKFLSIIQVKTISYIRVDSVKTTCIHPTGQNGFYIARSINK